MNEMSREGKAGKGWTRPTKNAESEVERQLSLLLFQCTFKNLRHFWPQCIPSTTMNKQTNKKLKTFLVVKNTWNLLSWTL
jgi:hypothetical protein